MTIIVMTILVLTVCVMTVFVMTVHVMAVISTVVVCPQYRCRQYRPCRTPWDFVDDFVAVAGRRMYVRSLPQPCGRTSALR
jgi:hypothetical protein